MLLFSRVWPLNDRKFIPALFARLAAGDGLALIQRCRALRLKHVAPAFGQLQCRLRQDGATPERHEAIRLGVGGRFVEQGAMTRSARQVRRLPVVDRDKRLVGIVALGDFAVESTEIQPAAKALSEISKPS